jgi:hypothetical protein
VSKKLRGVNIAKNSRKPINCMGLGKPKLV